ncbi:MAG: 6-phosphogluconolactonase [Rectinema sp.]
MTIERFLSEKEWIRAAQDAALAACRLARSEGGKTLRFCLAGGSTPAPLYAALASDSEFEAECADIRLEIWLGDERQVPPDAPERNAVMIRRSFAPALPGGFWALSAELHPWPDLPASEAARLYAQELEAASGGLPVFDFVLLGMGADGHIAGLFPGDRSALECRSTATAARAPAEPAVRMTLTFPVFDAARAVVLFVRGRGKAGAVDALARGDVDLPAARLRHSDARILYLEDSLGENGE